MTTKAFLLLLFLISLVTCNIIPENAESVTAGFNHTNKVNDNKRLPDAWYQGQAEISTYDIQQNRYNNLHPGEAVMIFVTEDFLKDKQVKNDNYTAGNSTAILKNNQIRKFTTGIYDYSMFTSVFTDVQEKPNTLKVTMSSQDWCGQSFTQLNKRGTKTEVRGFSYFENEGDKKTEIANALMIDEVFNMIRIDDGTLPTGDIVCIPSTTYSRLRHKTIKPYEGKALSISYSGDLTDEPAKVYIIKIPDLDLKYEFLYHDNQLRDLIQWSEAYPSAFDGKVRKTVATRKSLIWSDYWSKNALGDSLLRKELKLKD